MSSVLAAIFFLGIVGTTLELLESTSKIARDKAKKESNSFFSDLEEDESEEVEDETIFIDL